MVTLFGTDQEIGELAVERAQDKHCRQLPRVVPHNAYHVRVLFDPAESDEKRVVVRRIDVAFEPERWTRVYAKGAQSSENKHFLSDVPRGVLMYFRRLVELEAFHRLMNDDPDLLELDDEDEAEVESIVRPAERIEERRREAV